LTQAAFDKFLACLDADREVAGQQYEKIRAKLISYFEWRDCAFPEDHADETINRVVRKIDEEGPLRDPSTYVFGVARMLLLEIAKEQHRKRAAIEQLPRESAAPPDEDREQKVECLKRCLQELPPGSRELITAYYQGEKRDKIENRKNLADKLGMAVNALRIKACRLRDRLGDCLEDCMKKI
jgi:DNA-directed RNA polymerase specialized sigma24 family protein